MSRRRMTVLVVAGILVLAGVGIALGKGPESVTLTGPGIDAPIELMDAVDWPISCEKSCPQDPLVRLIEQSGLWYATGDLPRRIEEPTGELGPRYVLAWDIPGLSDGSVTERTIRQVIYLDAANGTIIHTPDQEGLEGWGSGAVGWFKAPDGIVDTLSVLRDRLSEAEASRADKVELRDRVGFLALVGLPLIVWVLAPRRRFDIAKSTGA